MDYNIPDLLRNGPESLSKLAAASGTGLIQLQRIMRVLSNNGIFNFDSATDIYSNNHISELLLSDHSTQWRAWVELYGNEFYDMARGIPAACHKDTVRSPAQINYDTDTSMFAYFTERNWTQKLHKTLGAGAIAQAPGLTEDYPWDSIKDCSFIDIGGGAGALAATILRKFPLMKGGVLDRPEVVAQARANFHSIDGPFADVAANVPSSHLIAGDFLTEVPAFEVYTMKWCLHDWDDEHALIILRNIRQAIVRGLNSRLIIFESILADGHSSRLSRYADLNMWIAVNGRERTEAQWRELAEQSGWTVYQIFPLRNAWPSAIEFRPLWQEEEQRSGVLDIISSKTTTSNEWRRAVYATANGYSLPSSLQVQSTMTFLEPWDGKKGNPFYRSAPAPGFQTINFKWVDAGITVTDARPLRDTFSLDRNGFRYLDDSEGLTDELMDALRGGIKDLVQQLYYPRVEALVKKETGASRVIIFDHTLRKRDPTRDKTENTTGKEQPATTVCNLLAHLRKTVYRSMLTRQIGTLRPVRRSQTPQGVETLADRNSSRSGKGALRRLKQSLAPDDDLDTVLKGRIQVIKYETAPPDLLHVLVYPNT